MTFRHPKDPADVAPYTVDFRGLIPATDSISNSTWVAVPGNITIGVPYNQARLTTAVLSGGVATFPETITITVNTTLGYTFQREVLLNIEDI